MDDYKAVVNGKFTQTRVAMIKSIYKKFMLKKKKKEMRMLTSDLGPLFRSLRFNPLESEIKEMIEEMDPEEEGTITFYQFLFLLWRRTLSGEEEEDVLPAFQVFDEDEDGFIPIEVLKKILTRSGEKLTEEEFEAFAKYADINEDGLIDIVDFVNRMNAEEPEQEKKKRKRRKKIIE